MSLMKYKLSANSPKTECELINRAFKLSGMRLIDFFNLSTPFVDKFISNNVKKTNGFLGQLMEVYLGASAKNLPIPDFPNLNIELKILPLNKYMFPKHPIKICYTSFYPSVNNIVWDSSLVKLKLNKVLWIPFESDNSIHISKRRICHPFLFNLKKYEKIIKQDYENIKELLILGKKEYISSDLGEYLNIKPISSNKKLTNTIDHNGELVKTNFIGFYLNIKFLKRIMYEYLHL